MGATEKRGTSRFDAIIVGAGHNGLIAAAYLARAGKRVVVLERDREIGGSTRTEEPFPGYRFSSCPSLSPLPPRIHNDLDLERHGLELLALPGTVWTPGGNGHRSLLLSESAAQSKEEISRFSAADSERYGEFLDLLKRLCRSLAPQLDNPPPPFSPHGIRDGLELLRLGGRIRRLGRKDLSELLRIPLLSLADFLSEWFETDLLRAQFAAGALIGSLAGPVSPGTASLLLYDFLTGGNAKPGPRVIPRGGMGNLVRALAAAAEGHGAVIRTGAAVERIQVSGETARGVALRGGEEILGQVVLSSADPKRTFLRLIDPIHLDPEFLRRVDHFQMKGAMAVVHLALDRLPEFSSLSGQPPSPALRGRVRISPDLEYLERAFDEAKHGCRSAFPFLECLIPSLTDPTLAPEGHHVMSILVQFAPYHLQAGSWEEEREPLADSVIELLDRYAPGLSGTIRYRSVLAPSDLEQRYGLTEGHIYHGEHSLDQLYLLRPLPDCAGYRTPIRNLYLCGAGTHPGGGVTGRCGFNAAARVLRDWQSAKFR
ncbi:MAG: NAD(P)/FAD-dependent oxidoreductase [Acidobacteria bacterium]|nr:NAD(P)/FAD-dependent oxidoreductase [Acidobacteriota bacterium]